MLPSQVVLEAVPTVLRAEVIGPAVMLGRDGLGTVDLHAADGVGRPAPGGQPEQRREDRERRAMLSASL